MGRIARAECKLSKTISPCQSEVSKVGWRQLAALVHSRDVKTRSLALHRFYSPRSLTPVPVSQWENTTTFFAASIRRFARMAETAMRWRPRAVSRAEIQAGSGSAAGKLLQLHDPAIQYALDRFEVAICPDHRSSPSHRCPTVSFGELVSLLLGFAASERNRS
jgi:hypothetical protein